MFNFGQVKNWDYETLKEWLKDPSTQEGWDYDFKSQLPNSRNKDDKDNLRATFCAFANSKSGLIFFGVSDKKSIVGIPYDQNFKTKVSDIISRKISPPIKAWDVFHSIKINSKNNFIYIVLIMESLYTDKPHMINEKVWIRENGHRRAIDNGLELQKLFFLSEKYYPQYDKLTLRVFERIRRSTDASISFLDILLLQKLKIYFEDSCKDNNKRRDYLPLLNKLLTIEKQLPRLKRAFLDIMEGNNREFLDAKTQLEKLIGEFLNRYKNIK